MNSIQLGLDSHLQQFILLVVESAYAAIPKYPILHSIQDDCFLVQGRTIDPPSCDGMLNNHKNFKTIIN